MFTGTWWFLLAGFVIPWIIFIVFFNRRKALTTWLFGIIVTAALDDIGSELTIWSYPIKFVPVGLLALPFDFSLIPVGFMFVYQYTKQWKSFMVCLFGLSIILAFVGESFSVWTGALAYYKWKHFYSFTFYILSGIIARWVTEKCAKQYSVNLD